MKDWSHQGRHGASVVGTALKRGVSLKDCSCATSAGYPRHGFALVTLCGWFWLRCLQAQAHSAWWCEGKLLSWSLLPCGNLNMKAVETTWQWVRDFPSRPDLSFTITALSHMLLCTTVMVRAAFRKGLAEVGSLEGHLCFSSPPLSASLCNEGAQSNRHL